MLLLAALGRSPRTDEVLSNKTGLTVAEIQGKLAIALNAGLIDPCRRLTDLGHAELIRLRRSVGRAKEELSLQTLPFYYPRKLRAPLSSSR